MPPGVVAPECTPEPSDAWVRSISGRLIRWGRENRQDFPWRRKIPFWQALVVEVMLQRTKAEQVAPVFRELRARYGSARVFGQAPPTEITELLRPLGLRWRSELVARLAVEIGASNGRLPRTWDELQRLPGVGPYSAAAALSLHGGQRAPIIDSNVVRLVCRLTGQDYGPETRRKAWLKVLVDRLTPRADCRDYNYAVLDHSMTVCRVTSPRCDVCVLRASCCSG